MSWRLECCTPTGQSGSSSQLVHNFGCSKHPEGTVLTSAEYAEWRGHPVVFKQSHLKVIDGGNPAPVTRKRKPRRRSERWFTGITPELEDFS